MPYRAAARAIDTSRRSIVAASKGRELAEKMREMTGGLQLPPGFQMPF